MAQQLQILMKEHHDKLLKQWFEQVIGAYPSETHKYFEKVNNDFTNPVGSNVYKALDRLLSELEQDGDADQLYRELEMILRIRAVQDMKPSKALAFVFGFKSIIRKMFQTEITKGMISQKELQDFFSQLDSLGLIGFDLYTESRELIFQLRITQIKETNDLLQKANLLNEPVDTCTLMRCSNHIEQEGENL